MKFQTSFLITLCSYGVFAEEKESPCDVLNGGASAGILCVNQKLKNENEKLINSYTAALNRIENESPDIKEYFIDAQKSWREFVNSECEFIGASLTSSPWRTVQIEECKLKMTKERVEYLDKVFVG